MNPDYQIALAALVNTLPMSPRPLPPWAPTVPFALAPLVASVFLACVALVLVVEAWLRVSAARGEGQAATIVSVTRQRRAPGRPDYIVYEYAFQDADGVRRTERVSATLADGGRLEPGGQLRVWPATSLLTRLAGRRAITEPMRASHRKSALPLAVCGAVTLIGALLGASLSQRSWSERRLLAEGELVRGEVVSTYIRSRWYKPKLVVIFRFSGPGEPVEGRYTFPSGRAPADSSGFELRPGDTAWIALRSDKPSRSVPWAFLRRGAATN